MTHGRREHVVRCLDSCVRQDYAPLEFLLFVNPAGDGTEEIVAERFPSVRMIRAERNLGFFPALNTAISSSAGDFIMTVDDDAYFLSPDAIRQLVAAFQKEPSLGAVTCNLEGPTETLITGGDRYVHLFTTGFTMVPRRAFTEWVGYYPNVFFRSGGETFLCSALWELGHPVKRLEAVRMYHARTSEARPEAVWRFHALRSQILCGLMRDPWYLIVPSLCSKAARSFLQHAHRGQLWLWAHAWVSALLHVGDAARLRKPISWRTQKLLWRLRDTVVTEAP